MQHNFSSFYKSKEFSDIEVVIRVLEGYNADDGASRKRKAEQEPISCFPAHKVILSEASDMFAAQVGCMYSSYDVDVRCCRFRACDIHQAMGTQHSAVLINSICRML